MVGDVGSTYSDMLKTLKTSLKNESTIEGIRGVRKSAKGDLMGQTEGWRKR